VLHVQPIVLDGVLGWLHHGWKLELLVVEIVGFLTSVSLNSLP
jgi:hypothetical protein